MRHMGDVLAGIQATWEFETDSVLIRFERGIRAPKLFQALRERRIPHEALSSVSLAPGKRGTVVLRAVPRPGADPLMEAAAGQLKESGDPYRLVLPASRETLAEYYADELRTALEKDNQRYGRDARDPAERYLVAAPEPPMQFKAYDAKALFDGRRVSFHWFWTGASSAKWKAGDQTFPVTELHGVEWRSPEGFDGYLRLLRRDPHGQAHGQAHGQTGAAGTSESPGRPRPTTIPRPSSSGSATGPCTSRCPSPPPCSRRSRAAPPRPGRRPPCTRWRRGGATRPTSPSGSGTWASCTGRAW